MPRRPRRPPSSRAMLALMLCCGESVTTPVCCALSLSQRTLKMTLLLCLQRESTREPHDT